MSTTILWSDVIGSGTIEDGGKAGDLMKLAFAYVSKEMGENRLTQAEAGQIYTAMIPAAFQHSIQFTMNKAVTEAAADKAIADADLAKLQADREYVLTLASIKKVYGFDYTLDAEDNIIRNSLTDTSNGQMDHEAQLTLEKVETEALHNDPDGLIVAQIVKMKADAATAEVVSDREYALMLSSIDKVYGFSYTLTDGKLNRESLTDTADGKMDYESALVKEQTDETIAGTIREDQKLVLSKIPSVL